MMRVKKRLRVGMDGDAPLDGIIQRNDTLD